MHVNTKNQNREQKPKNQTTKTKNQIQESKTKTKNQNQSWEPTTKAAGSLVFAWHCKSSQLASRWANHAITTQQSIDSKIHRIELEGIFVLYLDCNF